MKDELRELQKRVAELSDEELRHMVTVDSGDYRKEAIDLALRELEARGLSIDAGADEARADSTDLASRDDFAADDGGEGEAQAQGALCPTCNGPVRPAVLMGEREVVAVFRDNEEKRFVDIVVCRRCGETRLIVDLESTVTDE